MTDIKKLSSAEVEFHRDFFNRYFKPKDKESSFKYLSRCMHLLVNVRSGSPWGFDFDRDKALAIMIEAEAKKIRDIEVDKIVDFSAKLVAGSIMALIIRRL